MLNQKETKQLSALLKKIDRPREGLPQPVFDALSKIVPFVACELVIKTKEGILLTWREDEWWKGWHFPGGLLRYRESLKERVEKIARKELGASITKHDFLFVKDCYQCVRGPIISLVFLCQIKTKPKSGEFFKKIPKDIIEDHKDLWERAENMKYRKIKKKDAEHKQ